jgi:HSP20 family protein
MAANVTTRDQEVTAQAREATRAPERFLRPAVNITEEEGGLLITAEMPGASKQALDISVEKGVLTINADATREMPGRPIYTEFELAPYYRQFQIPEEIDQHAVRAEFNNGVLKLHLPKAEAAKPRKIEISIAD